MKNHEDQFEADMTMMTVTMMMSISTRTDDYLEGGEGGDYAGGLIEVW